MFWNKKKEEAKPQEEELTKKEKFVKEAKSYILIIVGVFAFRSSILEPNHIPTGSLLPTNAIGDFIAVNKMSYGFKLPYSDLVGDPVYLTGPSTPERGDIVVFEFPRQRSILYVKRLIGLPGDTIEVYNNDVYLNDKKIEKTPVTDKEREEYLALYESPHYNKEHIQFFKNKIGDREFITAEDTSRPYYSNQTKVTVPEGNYFMMGDNRDFSSDSRFWGFVPHSHLHGRAFMVWFNMVYPWSKEPFNFRPWRIGKLL